MLLVEFLFAALTLLLEALDNVDGSTYRSIVVIKIIAGSCIKT
jgi:hypothetical protein